MHPLDPIHANTPSSEWPARDLASMTRPPIGIDAR